MTDAIAIQVEQAQAALEAEAHEVPPRRRGTLAEHAKITFKAKKPNR